MNKTRCSYVKRKTYLAVLKQIKAKCSSLGVKLKLYNRPIIWTRFGGRTPNFGEQRGYYKTADKTITIISYGKIGYARKLELLFHELRHAIHHNEGLFSDYYKEEWDFNNLEKLAQEKNPKLPCRKNALLAEVDCNRYAYYQLKKQGILIPKDFSYKSDTMADSFHKEFNNLIRLQGLE